MDSILSIEESSDVSNELAEASYALEGRSRSMTKWPSLEVSELLPVKNLCSLIILIDIFCFILTISAVALTLGITLLWNLVVWRTVFLVLFVHFLSFRNRSLFVEVFARAFV